ncbi:MAG: hypothetical protein GY820_25815 [Gammaproteobacteria bacterium]|nr:hypothetical protein [Gammaproteobacteria bacterium]
MSEVDEIIKSIDHLIAVEDQRIKARTERTEHLLQIIKNTKEINEQPLHSIWNKFLNKIGVR